MLDWIIEGVSVMLKRRMLVALLALMCVGSASRLYAWLTYQEDRITDENYQKLSDMWEKGEGNLADIEAVLGRPADHCGYLPSEYKTPDGTLRWMVNQDRDGWRSWFGRRNAIHVLLYDSGFAMTMTELPRDTFWDKVRRLCPWIQRVW
jgi:hypothetical protein